MLSIDKPRLATRFTETFGEEVIAIEQSNHDRVTAAGKSRA